jgi:hypothetical protein
MPASRFEHTPAIGLPWRKEVHTRQDLHRLFLFLSPDSPRRRQVLKYFDATVIGLAATPSRHTLGFFK